MAHLKETRTNRAGIPFFYILKVKKVNCPCCLVGQIFAWKFLQEDPGKNFCPTFLFTPHYFHTT